MYIKEENKMQKAINLEQSGKVVRRVLSVADPSVIENNPTNMPYILIEDYEGPPALVDPAMDIPYPMYNTETNTFFWVVINYQRTVAEDVLDRMEMQNTIANMEQRTIELQNLVDVLLAESLLSHTPEEPQPEETTEGGEA